MTRQDIIDHIRAYLEGETEEKGSYLFYRPSDDFIDGRINLLAIANIAIEICARICAEADFDDMGRCAAELRGLIPEESDQPKLGPTDKERLDWLDQVNKATNDRIGTKYGWKFDINHNRAAFSDNDAGGRAVRQALDEAIRQAHLAKERAEKEARDVCALAGLCEQDVTPTILGVAQNILTYWRPSLATPNAAAAELRRRLGLDSSPRSR
jgi:hypothetical protein